MGIHGNEDLSKSSSLLKPSMFCRNVILVQPIYKNIPQNALKTTTELQVQEAQALLSTMESHLRLCDTLCLTTKSERKQLFFGRGNFNVIIEAIKKHERKFGNVTVFLNVNTLTPLQHYALHRVLGVDVYDRYMLVLQIFKHHARTKEAKLQTALAEIPYYHARMGFYGTDDMLVQLKQREVYLKHCLEELKGHRAVLRQSRRKFEIPVAAVVGYTNAGKTSLIKKLTDAENLCPRNQLFATLDVTCHEARLPRLGRLLYVDTVGFISDIPTQLIGSFKATLEDALLSDTIVHICDLSHPDLENQCDIVMRTLEEIGTPQRLIDTMLHLGNKVDLLPNADLHRARAERILGRCLPISAATAHGLRDALAIIESTLIEATCRGHVQIRCRTGSLEYTQIYRQSDVVVAVTPADDDENYSVMSVTITPASLQKLQSMFRGNSTVQFL